MLSYLDNDWNEPSTFGWYIFFSVALLIILFLLLANLPIDQYYNLIPSSFARIHSLYHNHKLLSSINCYLKLLSRLDWFSRFCRGFSTFGFSRTTSTTSTSERTSASATSTSSTSTTTSPETSSSEPWYISPF